MRDYKTPGVYVEEKSILPGSVAGVSTAIPAFIGYTQKAGISGDSFYIPTKVTTLKEYEDLFGTGADETINVVIDSDNITSVTVDYPKKIMYYSMQMFFNNGGESCYIVALNSADAIASESDRFKKALSALEFEDEPTLIILVDGVSLSSSDYYALCDQVLAQCNKMKDRFGVFDVIEKTDKSTAENVQAFRDASMNYLKYGAAYYPYIKTTVKCIYSDSSIKVTIDGAAKVMGTTPLEAGTVLYNRIKKEIDKLSLTLPPSSSIAGVYASVDRDRGVWKAPANVSLSSVTGPSRKITELENDNMNIDPVSGKSVNVIRAFTGKGTLVWGARTLAGNDNEWRYVSVRRLFSYIEESIQKATSFAVFEPNTAMTWLKLRSMIESFLDSLWRQGALAGGKGEDAYFVQVGLGTTMTSQDILEGRLIIKVGLAAVRPAEFIILEFTHKLQQS